MHFYPAYKVDDVFNEYAIRYYLLLDRALEISIEEQQQRIEATLMPHYTEETRLEIANSYKSILDGEPEDLSAKIKEDRERLRAKLSRKKNA